MATTQQLDPLDGTPEHALDPRPASGFENLITLFGGVWLVVGLFIDGYAHSEIIDTETEDFFTPWHGIFYSGFLFSTAVVGWIASRRSSAAPVWRWLPAGYGWAATGIGIFALGGIGDGIWHTILGVETGIDALLSPTHLLLFIGMALILSAPLRSTWLHPGRGNSWSELGGAIASTAITTALVAFFVTYVFGLGENWTQQLVFDPITEQNENAVALGLASAFVATMVLSVPALTVLRRWDLPPGGLTVLWTIPVILENLAFGGVVIAIPSVVFGGLATEALIATLTGPLGRRRAIIASMGLGTVGMWSAWMALTHLTDGVRWLPELWTGQIAMCGLVATGLAIAVFPPPVPAGADPDAGRDRASSSL